MHQNDALLQLYLQQTVDEKEFESFTESLGVNFGVITSSDLTRVGRTANLGVVDYQIRDLEKFTYNQWQVLKLKIPSVFF